MKLSSHLSRLCLLCLIALATVSSQLSERLNADRTAIELTQTTKDLPSSGVDCTKYENAKGQHLSEALGSSVSLSKALTHWLDGDCETASASLVRLVRNDPRNVSAWYWKGIIEANLGLSTSAAAFQEAGAGSRIVGFAQEALEKKKFDQLSQWLHIFAQMPEHSPSEVYRIAWSYYERGDREAALRFLNSYYSALPHDSLDGLRTAGMIARVEGRIDEAIQYYERGLQDDPTDLDLLYRLRTTYLDIGDYENALRTALIEAQNTPDPPQRRAEIQLFIARAYRLKGDFSQAQEWAISARNTKPDWRAGHTELGVIYCSTDQVVAGLAEFDIALALPGDALEALNAKAQCLYQSGDTGGGIEVMESMIDRFGNDVRLIAPYLLLARWFAKNDRCTDAFLLLSSGVKKWPMKPSLKLALNELRCQ